MPGVDKYEQPEASSEVEEKGPTIIARSPLQSDVLRRLRQNMQHNAIAHELGVSGSELATQIRHILTSIGAPDRSALLMRVDGLEPDDVIARGAPPSS
jgi:DNA-binding NarL/FixJ family response regulator